ncbi:MAG: hypothetical protein NW207_01550 [Cytophagales bacterium]|nr:hypothetical protein [Cytophagales bacterium]
MKHIFSPNEQIFSAAAPGRLDVMGGVSDYSGALLLQIPIKQKTVVKLQPNSSGVLLIRSVSQSGLFEDFAIEINNIKHVSYAEAQKQIKSQYYGEWACYIAGCFVVMDKEKGLIYQGATLEITSEVPQGKGVSSSASLEVATLMAICQAYKIKLGQLELPILAQKVENLVVGAACGLMDQLAVYLGKRDRILPITCKPHEVYDHIAIPKDIHFCGIDSGATHHVSDDGYTDARIAAYMGYTMIAAYEDARPKDLMLAKESGNRKYIPYHGYLANISVSEYEEHYEQILPEEITGREFIAQYQLTIDTVTEITPSKKYRVKACTRHPIFENFRVNTFYRHLQSYTKSTDKTAILSLMGELMYQSHAGYTSIGLGSTKTDDIVHLAREMSMHSGIFGAKITGGGMGGTVCILAHNTKGLNSAAELHKYFCHKNNTTTYFFTGSSDGGYFERKVDKQKV